MSLKKRMEASMRFSISRCGRFAFKIRNFLRIVCGGLVNRSLCRADNLR